MKSYYFEAVTWNGAVYCVDCLPDGVNVPDEDVHPVFADSEWDCYPTCDACHAEHDYVNLTSDGWVWYRERNWSKRMKEFAQECRDHKLDLPSFTPFGSYTLVYIDKEGNEYCGKCANETNLQLELEGFQTYDEGPVIQCDECQEDIESSYGDPDDKEDDK